MGFQKTLIHISKGRKGENDREIKKISNKDHALKKDEDEQIKPFTNGH